MPYIMNTSGEKSARRKVISYARFFTLCMLELGAQDTTDNSLLITYAPTLKKQTHSHLLKANLNAELSLCVPEFLANELAKVSTNLPTGCTICCGLKHRIN